MSVLTIDGPATAASSAPPTPSRNTHAKTSAETDEEPKEHEEEMTPEQILAARRAKRQAILAKYSSAQPTPPATPSSSDLPSQKPDVQMSIAEAKNSAPLGPVGVPPSNSTASHQGKANTAATQENGLG